MVICLERGADVHMAQLMPLPLTVSCFSKIQIGSTFLVPAHPGSPGQRAVKQACVCKSLLDSAIVSRKSLLCHVDVLNTAVCVYLHAADSDSSDNDRHDRAGAV